MKYKQFYDFGYRVLKGRKDYMYQIYRGDDIVLEFMSDWKLSSWADILDQIVGCLKNGSSKKRLHIEKDRKRSGIESVRINWSLNVLNDKFKEISKIYCDINKKYLHLFTEK